MSNFENQADKDLNFPIDEQTAHSTGAHLADAIHNSSGEVLPIDIQPARLAWAVPAVCLFLVTSVFAVFGQTLYHDFVDYDDNEYVYKNPHVINGLSGSNMVWAFSSKDAGNWHPLTWISHEFDCQLYGLKPSGHHLTNVLLHAAVAVILFLVIRQMTGQLWPSAFVAAIFAIHPLRVESVAWVAERKDVLSGLFFMLTLWAYCVYAQRPTFSYFRYILVIVFFALGLMAKSMLVSLPLVLLFLDYWPLKRWKFSGVAEDKNIFSGNERGTRFGLWRLILEKLPLFALVIASCTITLWAQSEAIVTYDAEPLYVRICNTFISYVAYIGQIFYPFDLSVLYIHPGNNISLWKTAIAFIVFASTCCAVVILSRRRPYFMTGWLWYITMLLPVIGLVQVGQQAMADRYTYLPQIGLYIAIVWAVCEFSRGWPYRNPILTISSILIILVLATCAYRQTSFWQNSETLWRHALSCDRQNYIAHNNLAFILNETNRPREALEHCEEAINIKPDHYESQNNMGIALGKLGHLPEAISHFQQALRIKPDYPNGLNNLGIALCRVNRVHDSIEYFQKALQIKTDKAEPYGNLGNAYMQMGRTRDAIEQYEQMIRLMPDSVEAYMYMAQAYAKIYQTSEALAAAQKAFDIAQSKGQADAAKEIGNWMTNCREKLRSPSNAH